MRWRTISLGIVVALVAGAGLYTVFDSLNPPTGCGVNVGPTAMLGIDPVTGDVNWTHRAGHVRTAEFTGGRVTLDAETHETTLDLADGIPESCWERQRVVDVPVQATVRARPDDLDEQAALDFFDKNEGWELWHELPGFQGGNQFRLIRVVDITTEEAWETEIESLALFLFTDEVVSIHQANGGSVVTTYDPATRDTRWRVPIPGSSFVASRSDGVIVVASASELIALSVDRGEEVWRTDLGNPGRTGDYSEGGWVRSLDYDPASGNLVARVEASQPYRD